MLILIRPLRKPAKKRQASKQKRNVEKWLPLFNKVLTVVVIALGIYIICLPFLPELSFRTQAAIKPFSAPETAASTPHDPVTENIPEANTLVIPSLNLEEVVHEGPTEETLWRGVWRRPNTSTPSGSSNTVLSGHGFTYRGASVFYHLNKVKVGDTIHLFWEGKKYSYKVFSISTVPPTEISVEVATKEPILTLYTCAPVWSAENRLVVKAKLDGGAQ